MDMEIAQTLRGTARQRSARKRNWKIYQLKLFSLKLTETNIAQYLDRDRIIRIKAIVDEELIAMGATPLLESSKRKLDFDEDF